MKGLSIREKVLLIILLVVAICLGYYKFFLNPMLVTINERKSSIASLEIQEQKIKDAPAVKEKLTSQLNEASVLYNASILEVPRQYRNSEIAYQLKALCDANSTVLSSISLGAGSSNSGNQSNTTGTDGTNTQASNASTSGIFSVPVVISITGNYNNLMSLINAIENNTRIAQVESIGMSGGSTNEELTANINLTYYYIENGEAAEEIYNFNTDTYGKTNLFN